MDYLFGALLGAIVAQTIGQFLTWLFNHQREWRKIRVMEEELAALRGIHDQLSRIETTNNHVG